MMICKICGEPFNPACLSEVFEHEHKGISTDKEYYGVEITEDEKTDFAMDAKMHHDRMENEHLTGNG